MRIAYVYDACYPWEAGGIQKRVWEIARRLAEDHDVHWYTLHYWDGPQTTTRDGVTLHGVGEPPELYVDGRRSIPEALLFSARLLPGLLRSSFDVIDCQEFPYFPVFPSKLGTVARDTVLVVTWHEVWGDYWYEYLGRKGVFGKAVERVAAMLPDQHVAVSNRTRREVQALGGVDATLVPNGIEMDEVEAAPVSPREVDVLFVGRFIEEKNPTLVVDAVARLGERGVELNCVFLGDGPEQAAIEAKVERHGLGDRVAVLPPREEYGDVLGLMKAASVLALPSRREGFGITALEALGCGTPVVTVCHPQNAIEELVADGTTGAIRPETANGIADGIETSVDLSAADCVATAREYEWDWVATRTEQVYEGVTN